MPCATDGGLRLAPGVVPRGLETPWLYHSGRDELYELSPDAFDFIERVGRGEEPPVAEEDRLFVESCLAEGLLLHGPGAMGVRWTAGRSAAHRCATWNCC